MTGHLISPVECRGLTLASISFLKMISVATVGGTVINYSPRFSLTGMTGIFPPAVTDGLAGVTGTDGPPTLNQVAGQNNKPGADGPYAQPYTLQTGLTRYAPMQPVPPTKITANKATPLWPTSSVSIAKTWLPRPSIVTTLTQNPTYSVTSRENNVCHRFSHDQENQEALKVDWRLKLLLTLITPDRHLLHHNRPMIWRNSWPGGKTRRLLDEFSCWLFRVLLALGGSIVGCQRVDGYRWHLALAVPGVGRFS